MNINPGELSKSIQIIRFEETVNARGFPIKTEKVVRTCQAKYTQVSGTEVVKANSEFESVKCRFLVREPRGKNAGLRLDTDMVVRYGGKDYQIVYVNSYGDSREYVEIWTERTERV